MTKLPAELMQKWDRAWANPGESVSVGRLVVCDSCDTEWTNETGGGGFIFETKAICPKCAPTWERRAEKFDELRFIRARCPDGQSFADFVRGFRGPNAAIRVTIGSPR